MSPGLRKGLSRIYHPKGWPGQAGKALQHPRCCCSAWQRSLLHPLELFTCRALLQHLEVRAPGRSAGALCTTKPWAAPLSCSPSPIINSFSGPTGFTCYHIPKKGRRSTQRRRGGETSHPLPPGLPQTSEQLRSINSTCTELFVLTWSRHTALPHSHSIQRQQVHAGTLGAVIQLCASVPSLRQQ